MIYDTYINKAYELVLLQNEDNGVWYLDPNWLHVLYTNGLEIEKVSEEYIGKHEVRDALKLEVERRNLHLNDKKQEVIDWLYDIITAKVEPQILQEETEYVAQMLEYLKFREKTAGNKPIKNDQAQLPDTLLGMDFKKK